jgi:diadenosine tetraphosphate (Ap4A) HIT family hydrolase
MVCRFCQIPTSKNKNILLQDSEFIAISDAAPVCKGHTLIILKRHVVSFFDLRSEEVEKIYKFILNVRKILDTKYHPQGYNIGINEGKAAGRSIDHLHIHIMPRYPDDIDIAKGGVRNIFNKNISPYEEA